MEDVWVQSQLWGLKHILQGFLQRDVHYPGNLLVFVNPLGEWVEKSSTAGLREKVRLHTLRTRKKTLLPVSRNRQSNRYRYLNKPKNLQHRTITWRWNCRNRVAQREICIRERSFSSTATARNKRITINFLIRTRKLTNYIHFGMRLIMIIRISENCRWLCNKRHTRQLLRLSPSFTIRYSRRFYSPFN